MCQENELGVNSSIVDISKKPIMEVDSSKWTCSLELLHHQYLVWMKFCYFNVCVLVL
jgi:hypothetical protein